MKKQFLICAILACTHTAYGQFSFGIKAGANLNSINASSLIGGDFYKSSVAFHFGVFGQLRLKEKFFFIPELQFTQRGSTFRASQNPDVRINLNYIELPILFSYQLVKKINIDIGPNISLKTSAVATDGKTASNVDNLYDKNIDFGISAGLRVNISDRIAIIGRYYYGISPITEILYADANNNQTKITLANRSLQFGLSYKLLN
jgi:hypothetical protein